MIVFRRLGGKLIALNPDLIERVEVTPDTVITLVGEKKFLVEESLEQVLEMVTDYRSFVMARSYDLQIDERGGQHQRPVLHVVPAEHVAAPEAAASGEIFELEPLPDVLPEDVMDDGSVPGSNTANEGLN